MSAVLGIDTSSTELGLGLYRIGRPVACYSRYIMNSHAEHITRSVTMLLDENGMTAGDIAHIAIGKGPGSFTGLRIGFAFVKGFSAPGGVRVLALSSLFILAHGVDIAEGTVVAAIDARREGIFCARFRPTIEGLIRETDDALLQASDFRDFIFPNDTIITDTLGYSRSNVFAFLAGRERVFPVDRRPFARGLLCAALGAAALERPEKWCDPAVAQPSYLRSFSPPPVQRGMKP
jgi:tRNA threonylcarbamoyl adenosine modification protein YeaZ